MPDQIDRFGDTAPTEIVRAFMATERNRTGPTNMAFYLANAKMPCGPCVGTNWLRLSHNEGSPSTGERGR